MPRGGIRRRLQLDSQLESDRGADEAPLPPKVRRAGGIKQRLGGQSTVAPNAPEAARGGVKQRLANQSHGDIAAEDLTIGKPLNRRLLRDWVRGKTSAKDVLEYALAAHAQGCPGLGKLANKDVHNAARNIVTTVGYPKKAPKISWIQMPCKDGSVRELPIICPIDQVEALLAKNPKRFEKHVKGNDGEIQEFWLNIRNTPMYKHNRAVIDINKTIAVKLHGDKAPTTKVDGCMTLSWSTMHGTGNTRDTRMVFAIVPGTWLCDESYTALFDRLAWAFNALTDGILPGKCWLGRDITDGTAGRELCSGWKVAAIFVGSDWEFYQNVCGFPAPNSTPCMCWSCSASPGDGPLCFTSVDKGAGWRRTMRTHAMYLAECAASGKRPCRLMKIKTLVLEGHLHDGMHSMDEGFLPEFIGNAFYEIMELGHWSSNQHEKAAGLDKGLKKHYRETKEKTQIDGRITFERVRLSGDWPCFRAKAAATRHLAPFVQKLCRQYNDGSDHDMRRLAIADGLVRVYEIFGSPDMFFTDEVKLELEDISQTMMGCYRNLSIESLHKNERKWKIKPKFHSTQHILEHQSFINTSKVWLYSDEDLMRHVKEVALSCHPAHVPYMSLYKWICSTFGEFDEPDD